jgi:DUF4097 and DUF4098 domain-containing protein YvlB
VPLKTLAFAVLLLAIAAHADEWKKDYSVTGTPEVKVDSNDGNIEVTTGSQSTVSARVITAGWRIGVGHVHIVDEQKGNRIELEVRTPHLVFFGISRHSIRVELTVPRSSNLDLHSGDGRISLAQVTGDLHLNSGDGAIEASGLDGRLNATTSDGHISVQGRFDQLDLRTGDGRIEAEVASGSKMQSAWSARTADGGVRLRLPQNFASDLDLRTGDGHITLDFPVTVSGRMSPSNIHGKLNGGGELLQVRTSDGSISLERE